VKNTRAVKPLSLSAIAARVDPGLVDVNVVFGYQGARGAGTGIVLTPTGEVLTNNHVIDGATSVSVTDLGNGKTYSASVVGYDRSRDLAILRLSGARGLATAPIGNSSTLKLGARVTAIGNAGGRGGTPSMARGTVTALHQSIIAGDPGGGNFEHLHGLVETNANIQPGDSGGPLVNIYGQIVAMDTAASGGPQLSSTATQGFAIPINEALSVGRQIEARTGSSTVHIGPTAFLGVGIAAPGAVGGTTSSGSSFSGALIGSVLQGSPAQRAGLAGGDVITSLGGHAVRSGAGLADTLIPYHPGDTVQVQWVDQSGTVHSASVTLAIGPSA
jgi:S1-C subfamily serine protease